MISKIIKGIIITLGLLLGAVIFVYGTSLTGLIDKDNSFVWYVTGIIISSLIGGWSIFYNCPKNDWYWLKSS